jgi:iron(III) transport system ATP-binding protein
MTGVRLRGVSKRYGNVEALAGIDLTVPSGTRTAIVGPSGSGKTTLLRLIAGFEVPDAGEILFDGVLVADRHASVPPHRRNFGLVMQDGALFPHLTVLQNIRFGMGRDRGDEAALELLDQVELDRAVAARQPHELSGGQQQRVALARALARRPGLMLLDEPFSALDAGLREQMREAAAALLERVRATTILVTHDQEEAMSFGGQLVVLRAGRLIQAGSPQDLYRAPADLETAEFLGPAIVLPAVIRGGLAHCSLGALPLTGTSLQGPATVVLRPDQIVLGPPETSPPEARLGRVLTVVHAGPVARITLALGEAEAGLDPPSIVFKTRASAFRRRDPLFLSPSLEAHMRSVTPRRVPDGNPDVDPVRPRQRAPRSRSGRGAPSRWPWT